MSAPSPRSAARGLASLRRLASDRPAERCELCAVPIAGDHEHLVDPQSRRLLCACYPCAILFDGLGTTRYRRVPRDVRRLEGFQVDDLCWKGLAIPIGLAFLFRSSASGRVIAIFPSPAGPTEMTIEEDVWQEFAALHPLVAKMAADAEALLVNRTKGAGEYFIAPIDECYRLVANVRQYWQGFGGGEKVWQRIGLFFDDLKRRSRPERERTHA